MPFRVPTLECPTCSLTLRPQDVDGHGAHLCPSCAGVWFEQSSFFSLLIEHRPNAVRELMEHNDGTVRRDCPACREPMRIAWMDFLQLDECATHGIWFDSGELHRALRDETGTKKVEKMIERAQKVQQADAQKAGKKR